MQKFLNWLDDIAKIEVENAFAKWLERIAFIFLILMILSAPHSIAATQTAWLCGMLAWIIRFFIKPRPPLSKNPLRLKTPLDIALWAFLFWSLISSIFSYAPDISLDRLRNTLLFLIFYFVIGNLRSIRAAKFLAFALIFSAMVSVIWTPIERIFGRGVEVTGVSAESPLAKGAVIQGLAIADGDTIIEVNKRKIRTPESLIAELEKSDVSQVKYYRPDFNSVVEVRRADLLDGENAAQRLGISSWKHSRNWRSAGFYGHYTTFAEVLQLIASLIFGLFIALDKKRSRLGAILLFCVAAIGVALLLTVTRASQLAFLVSAFAIVLANGNRKMLLTLAAVVLPVALTGLFFLQQSRKVEFFDSKDDSTLYREMMYRDGFHLWTKNVRNFSLGVGMDSIRRYWQDWGLFDKGWQPMGHFHSTPLQLVVERGLPALLLWLWILFIYGRTLWRELKVQSPEFKVENPKSVDWQKKGIILGCFGGLVGFFTSGLVHYNLGDAEVAMVFFMLMGISVFLCDNKLHNSIPEHK
ncbi:MAG: O-antigen ligase family protein [Acidobacteria bacterium]|nr:O-antigen ligase family protein [Acidobacteriota bacterium]